MIKKTKKEEAQKVDFKMEVVNGSVTLFVNLEEGYDLGEINVVANVGREEVLNYKANIKEGIGHGGTITKPKK